MHPEVALWALNGERAMGHAKRTKDGFEERMAVLSRYLPNAREIVAMALREHPRKAVARDDVIDALVGAVTARFHPGLRCLPEALEFDDTGLPMEIVFAQPD
jgi:predicted RNase H-like nuclease